MADDLTLPTALVEVAEIGFKFEFNDETGESSGCDFEPYEQFESPEETTMVSQFRMFGSIGGGDYVGFWLVRPGVNVIKQPVVYISSDGELGVIAQDLENLLWLFANGSGPAEAFEDAERETEQNEEFQAIAEKYAKGKSRSTLKIVTATQEEFANFSELISDLCR